MLHTMTIGTALQGCRASFLDQNSWVNSISVLSVTSPVSAALHLRL